MLFFGIVNVLAGVIAWSWPGRTLVVVAVLFGIQLIVAGVFRFVAALAAGDESGSTRVLFALLGVLSFIVGLYAVRHVLLTLTALALLLGIYWIVSGLIEVFTALADRGMRGRGWTVLMGVLSMIAGLIVLLYPGISLLAMTIVLGAWLVVYGVMQVVLAFRLRSAAKAPAARGGLPV